jgi:hypothetical protein
MTSEEALRQLQADYNFGMSQRPLVLPYDQIAWSSSDLPAPTVAAGYPSPAQDHFDGIDLNEHLIMDVTSTYVVRYQGTR